MPNPCAVYLDTSDYSKFGDVLRGRGTEADEKIYDDLLQLKEGKKAIFPYSMPMLAELFQYDAQHRDTTMRKAEAVDVLAGEHAFISPDRLIAWEIANEALSIGLLGEVPDVSPISDDRYWHPNLGNALSELKKDLDARLDETIASSGHNRQMRRAAKAKSRRLSNLDFVEAAEQVVPEFSRTWELSKSSVRASIVATMSGKVSPEEGSRILFAEIARPTTFASVYFEKHDGPKDLPRWMSKFGAQIQNSVIKFREAAELVPADLRPNLIKSFREEVAHKLSEIGTALITALDDDAAEFGVSKCIIQEFSTKPELAARVRSCTMLSRIMVSYVMESVPEHGFGPEPERSAGGDFIHALYAPYADLWRGDRRFSHFLRTAIPEVADKIVPRLSDLPARIRQFHEQRNTR